jgi:hypothetical protein
VKLVFIQFSHLTPFKENALKNLGMCGCRVLPCTTHDVKGHGGTGLPQPQNVGMEIRHDLQNDTIATNLTVPQNYLQFFVPDPLPSPSEQVEPLATINPALLVLQHPVPQSSRPTPAYVNHDYNNLSAAKTIRLREDSGRGGNDSATEYDSTEDENGVSGVRNTDGHGNGNECNDPNYHNSNVHTQFGATFFTSVACQKTNSVNKVLTLMSALTSNSDHSRVYVGLLRCMVCTCQTPVCLLWQKTGFVV